jgi:leucyl/phenylalanyl-tRNA---protein transferase
MPVYLLPEEPLFPPVSEAEPDGLLAIGGDFSSDRLLAAYSRGIFPWFEEEAGICWFSPDPRMVLFPEKLRVSASLSRVLKQGRFEIRFDHDFRSVIEHCAKVPRKNEQGTWISRGFIEGYTRLHHIGYAHSAEAWRDGKLAGGLYGVSIGKVFFGESMFYLEPEASKVAFITLVRRLSAWGFRLIDCQMETEHLQRFGAEPIARPDYLTLLNEAITPASSGYPSGWR